ncbi:histidine phosphatase family protein [Paludibacterium purpuratum]|uniref:Alpha-ribazole phosphatase n=1 Tax=Paludibacterium purpuratum TaxID=1144873 RepID=A0A4R7B5C0_9NEIS|nr:histidine phosphatase family protein [Paludibacterium purpuratum]TDR79808.1 alpha-ribazole phosphatase [Paludibacterium purpuratum]
MHVWLIRHPRPMVESGVCYGRTDLAVADAILAEAAASIMTVLPPDVPVFSSPLGRCARLAEALAPGAVHYDARLMEMDFGSWEMRRWQDIERREVDAWVQDLTHFRPGHGESLTQMAERVAAFRDMLLDSRLAQAAVICHAGTIRLLDVLNRGLPVIAAATEAHHIEYGAVLPLSLRRD